MNLPDAMDDSHQVTFTVRLQHVAESFYYAARTLYARGRAEVAPDIVAHLQSEGARVSDLARLAYDHCYPGQTCSCDDAKAQRPGAG